MNVTEIGRSEWLRIAEDCEYATFFHSPIWADAVTNAFDNIHDKSLLVEFDNGTNAVLPLVAKSINVSTLGLSINVSQTKSTWAGCFGGIIADGDPPDGWRKCYQKAVESLSKTYNVNIVGNPLFDQGQDLGEELDDVTVEDDFTQSIHLEEYDDFDTLFSDFQSDVRQNTRQARKTGLEVRTADSIDDWEKYFGAYQDSLERWGDSATNNYDWEIFESLHNLASNHEKNIQLWLVEKDGELASGEINFYWNQHTVCWHAASYREYLEYSPNDLLHAEKIQDALDRGLSYYDFNPSGGHEGVVNFKSKFATDKIPIKRWTWINSGMDKAKKLKDLFTSE